MGSQRVPFEEILTQRNTGGTTEVHGV